MAFFPSARVAAIWRVAWAVRAGVLVPAIAPVERARFASACLRAPVERCKR